MSEANIGNPDDEIPVDIPGDFKFEHDKLIYEMEPIVERLAEILRELPKVPSEEVIEFGNCTVTIKCS